MKVLVEIDEHTYEQIRSHNLYDFDTIPEDLAEDVANVISEGTPLNGTNGDVLKAVYPNEVIEMDSKYFENHNQVITIDGSCYFIDSDWWNADYKGVE